LRRHRACGDSAIIAVRPCARNRLVGRFFFRKFSGRPPAATPAEPVFALGDHRQRAGLLKIAEIVGEIVIGCGAK